MKVSIGLNPQSGPWGGGNQVAHALTDYLEREGVEVSHDLDDPNLDLILLAEPRSNLRISAYSDADVLRYLLKRNWRTVVVHRVNECDERKGTNNVNRMLIKANTYADHTVFVSKWLRDLLTGQGFPSRECTVILNGSDRRLFHARGYTPWDGTGPLRLVTHHWGANWMKGFDVYHRIDNLLAKQSNRNSFSFTYIGNLPRDFGFHNVEYIPPLHGDELAQTLRSHHIYVTASRNEPGPNHQNEGASCGLPLLYRRSGALVEYCEGFGISFDIGEFDEKLEEMRHSYSNFTDRVKRYPHTAERMSSQYINLFVELLDRREEILERRAWQRSTKSLAHAFLPKMPTSVSRIIKWLGN